MSAQEPNIDCRFALANRHYSAPLDLRHIPTTADHNLALALGDITGDEPFCAAGDCNLTEAITTEYTTAPNASLSEAAAAVRRCTLADCALRYVIEAQGL